MLIHSRRQSSTEIRSTLFNHSVNTFCFLRDILRSLDWLHRHGWVHRDVRWANVVRNNRNYVLIDYELAGRIGAALPEILKQTANIPYPERLRHNGQYLAKDDIYLVQLLLQDFETILSDRLRRFQAHDTFSSAQEALAFFGS